LREKKRNDNRNNFIKQASILAVSGLLARFLGFLYRLPLTDLIGDEGNTIYSAGFYIYTFLLVVSSAGLPGAISKMVAERRAEEHYEAAHRLFKVAFAMATIIGAALAVFLFAFAHTFASLINVPEAALAIQVLAPTIFVVAMMAVIRGYFQGMSMTTPTAASQLIDQIFNAVFSIVLAHTLYNFAMDRGYVAINYAAAGGTLGSTVGAVAGFMFIAGIYFLSRKDVAVEVRRAINKRKREGLEPYRERTSHLIKTILITSTTIIMGTAIFTIVNMADLAMVLNRLEVAGFDESTARSLYGQVTGKFHPITNLPAAISSSLAIALIPAISAANALGKHKEVRDKINTGLRVGMFLTIPIALGLAVLGSQIVALLFPNHPDGGTLFLWGFASIIFLAISQIATGIVQGLGKTMVPVYAALAGAVVKIASTYFLVAIPQINIYGAVLGTTFCFLVAAAINCGYLFKHTKTKPDVKGMLLKPLFSSVGMAMGTFTFYHSTYFLMGNMLFSTIIAVFAGMALYILFMLLVKGFREEDVLFLPGGKKILSKMKGRGLI